MNQPKINGTSIMEYSAYMEDGYKEGSASITRETQKLKNRSSYIVKNTEIGLAALEMPVAIIGNSRADCEAKKNALDAAFMADDKIAIALNGYVWNVICTNISDVEQVTKRVIRVTYSFTGTKNGPRNTITGFSVTCESTAPKTDCIIKATASTDADEYAIAINGNVMMLLEGIKTGDVIQVDSEQCNIKINGKNAAQMATWTEFPYLLPGINTIEMPDEPTITYTPIYY